MSKVYLVTAGEYSDYHICGVFSTRELAENCLNLSEYMRIEESELDPITFDLKGMELFSVWMKRDGTAVCDENCTVIENINEYRFVINDLNIKILAKDRTHAIKIANEKRAQIIANNLWGKDSV